MPARKARTVTQRKQDQRKRDAEKIVSQTAAIPAEVLKSGLLSSVDMLRESGLAVPTTSDLADSSASDKANAINRIISAATKALDLARKRAELITADEHKAGLMAMAATLKRCIAQMPAYLPSDLEPHERKRCAEAMAKACVSALNDLEKRAL
jgi:hypothetical protein